MRPQHPPDILTASGGVGAGPRTPGRPPWTPGRPLSPWPAPLDPWPAPEPLAGPCTHEAVRGCSRWPAWGAGGPAGCTRCRTFFSLPGTSREPPWNSEVRERATLFAVGIWVSYVTSCYVTSCSVCPGSSVALGGGGGGGMLCDAE